MKTACVESEDPKPGKGSCRKMEQGKLWVAHSKKAKARNHQAKIIVSSLLRLKSTL